MFLRISKRDVLKDNFFFSLKKITLISDYYYPIILYYRTLNHFQFDTRDL